MRKFGIKYAQLHPQADQVKQAFIAVAQPQWQMVLGRWYAEDLPGRAAQSHGDCGVCVPARDIAAAQGVTSPPKAGASTPSRDVPSPTLPVENGVPAAARGLVRPYET